jgi:capsule polysaccharide export protein KpsE/RkpR
MGEYLTPDDVLKSTTPQVKSLVAEILKIERQFQHHKDLAVAGKESELCDQIIRLIEREIKQ